MFHFFLIVGQAVLLQPIFSVKLWTLFKRQWRILSGKWQLKTWFDFLKGRIKRMCNVSMITKTIIDQCYLILFFIFRKGVRFSFITFSSDIATETILKLTGDRYIWSSLIVGTVISNIPVYIVVWMFFLAHWYLYLTVNSPLYRIVQKWKEHKWNVQILLFVLVNFHWNFVQRFKWQFEVFWTKSAILSNFCRVSTTSGEFHVLLYEEV